MGYWRKVAAAAGRDTLALVRFDTISRSLWTLSPPVLTAILTYYYTHGVAWSAVAFAVVTFGFGGLYFLYLMIVIPARWASNDAEEIRRLSPAPASEVKRDVGLTEAIHYATTGEWIGRAVETEDFLSDRAAEALSKLRQFGFDREVQIWGLFNHEDHVYTPVPSDFWMENQVEFMSFIRGEPHTEAAAWNAPPNVYQNLMTCRAQIERAYAGFIPTSMQGE